MLRNFFRIVWNFRTKRLPNVYNFLLITLILTYVCRALFGQKVCRNQQMKSFPCCNWAAIKFGWNKTKNVTCGCMRMFVLVQLSVRVRTSEFMSSRIQVNTTNLSFFILCISHYSSLVLGNNIRSLFWCLFKRVIWHHFIVELTQPIWTLLSIIERLLL